ncbi:hypothetical protein GCM10010448_03050 [Streptomyces glomeratus]|uniref:Uncharacterized protein n=1 Tax=Streptomyces glomeratus TaxID=284452 RepID=A0ABN3YBU1_9ACTN
MVVPVSLVPGVPVAVVQIVDVVAVRDRPVTAAVAVLVLVSLVGDMHPGLALVPMAAVLTVQMAVVGVVDVIPVRYGVVSAGRAVAVRVSCVFRVLDAHGAHLRRCRAKGGSG